MNHPCITHVYLNKDTIQQAANLLLWDHKKHGEMRTWRDGENYEKKRQTGWLTLSCNSE